MDKELFETFYEKNYKKALGFIIKHRIPKQYAEDLLQDSFLEIYKKYDNTYIENPSLFYSFLKRRIADEKRDFKRQIETGVNLKRKIISNLK